jgi:hypothetical protein
MYINISRKLQIHVLTDQCIMCEYSHLQASSKQSRGFSFSYKMLPSAAFLVGMS